VVFLSHSFCLIKKNQKIKRCIFFLSLQERLKTLNSMIIADQYSEFVTFVLASMAFFTGFEAFLRAKKISRKGRYSEEMVAHCNFLQPI
jgi:hypothetical protein